MSLATIPGAVIRIQSGFHTVRTDQGTFTCHLRGRLKRVTFRGDVLAIGDRVQISLQSDGTAMIERIEPRQRALVRLDPSPKGDYQQVILANPDQVLLVFACADPEPHLRMLDRFLVICEKQGIPVRIVANKVDLVGEERARELFRMYPPIGYPVIFTSVAWHTGIEDLRSVLIGRETGLAGPSGVGKSSLLNSIQPELGLAVRQISQFNAKGRHTTNVREMFPLNEGGFVTDLPGLRSLALWDTQPEELDGYFPELRELVSSCFYNDCSHQNEPGCAVRAAVSAGQVFPERYESYLRLRYGEENPNSGR
jgi:ribosome biogenesis GTPase / thiamine phosphate phosphatase